MRRLSYRGHHITLTPELLHLGWIARAIVEYKKNDLTSTICMRDHCRIFRSLEEAMEPSEELGRAFLDKFLIP